MNKSKIFGYAIGSLGTGLLSAISLPIIAWFYPVEDIGRISMLQIFINLSTLLFCLGLDQAYVREYYEEDNKPALFKTALLPGLILGITVLSSIIVYDPAIISKWLYNISSTYLSALTVSCALVALSSRFFSLVLRMEERSIAFSMSQVLPKLLFLMFILITIWLGWRRNIYELITANTLSITAAFFIFMWNTRTNWIPSIKQPIRQQQLHQLIIFGFPLLIGGIASWGLNIMDKIFLRSMSTYSELGIYSVTISISGAVVVFTGIFNTIWSPLVYKWVAEKKANYQKINTISEDVLATVYFVVILSGVFAWILPYLLPKEYGAIKNLLTTCLLAPLLYTLSETTAVGITLAKKTKLAMFASVGAMLANLIGNYILVPKYGAAGAATSTAIAFWIFFILRTEFSKRVWYKLSSTKSYICTFALITLSIINTFTLTGDYPIIIWLAALATGLLIFSDSIKRLRQLTNMHKTNN